MAEVHIVTDSGADFPSEWRHPRLHVVPLTIHFGAEEFRDGVEMTAEAFYRRQRQAPLEAMPRTSQPSPADFQAMYEPLVKAGHSIVSVHLSGALSGTLQSASIAARAAGGDIHVVDSRSASAGISFLAAAAARRADAGEPAAAVAEHVRALRDRLQVFFTVDTLEHLQRNGRIGKAQAFVGGLLNVKPILTLADGVVHPVERVRGRRRAVARLLEHAQAVAAEGGPVDVAVLHGDAPEEGAALAEAVKERLPGAVPVVATLGPVIGSHVGPGTLGLLLMPKEGL